MKLTAEITKGNILNLNMLEGNELIMLSIPLKNNVVDMNEKILFSYYIDKKFITSGLKNIIEIFNIFNTKTLLQLLS